MLASTEDYYRAQQALSVLGLRAARKAWSQLDYSDITGSWAELALALSVVLSATQLRAATDGATYIQDALDEQGVSAPIDGGSVVPSALSNIASNGKPLLSLLDEPRIQAFTARGNGASFADSLLAGRHSLDRIAVTQVQDAGRVAAGVSIAARPKVTGYIRMLNPPSCSRCVVLAGKHYRWNAGFRRHPRCLPAGTVVSGPEMVGAARRWYDGELVTIRTAGGKQLSITANHPVLTDAGWLPAKLVVEGGYVVGRATGERAVGLCAPDHHEVPARVEDVWASGRMRSLGSVPVAAEDFHGDGVGGQVDVVLSDRLLGDGAVAQVSEQRGQLPLGWGAESAVLLQRDGVRQQVGVGMLATPSGIMGGRSLAAQGFWVGTADAHERRFTASADFDPFGLQSPADDGAADAESDAERVFALAGQVSSDHGRDVDGDVPTRWDAPSVPFAIQNSGTYASIGHDLKGRLSGQVELDRVVEVVRIGWSGHVYSLTSMEGWYDANGIIVSNCDCRHVPVTGGSTDAPSPVSVDATDPAAYFKTLSAEEQDRIFTKSGAQAIRDGADISQVVNARQGMSTAGGYKTTTIGTTKYSLAGQRLREATGSRNVTRLMPESILQIAGKDRIEAIRLLHLHGFVL